MTTDEPVGDNTKVPAPKTAIIVPTLGQRPQYLRECLSSIRQSGRVHIRLVAPSSYQPSSEIRELCDDIVTDLGGGLANAIHSAITTLPTSIFYVNWLGDDDQLLPGGIETLEKGLEDGTEAVLAFGGCAYVDAAGRAIFVNRSGAWASPLLSIGPQLVSQPAVLLRRATYERVGGLDTSLRFAFDLDLLLKARRTGKLRHVDKVVAAYRWHPDALTVGGRRQSVTEASHVRKQHLPPVLRRVSILWEPLVRNAIFITGLAVTQRMVRRGTQ